MNSFRDTIRTAAIISLLVGVYYILYFFVYLPLYPPKPAPTPVEPTAAQTATQPAEDVSTTTQAADGATASIGAASGYEFVSASSTEPVILGGGPDDQLKLELNPRGASAARIWLTMKGGDSADKPYRYCAEPEGDQPYECLRPVSDGSRDFYSFATPSVIVHSLGDRQFSLDINWETLGVSEQDGVKRAQFAATCRAADGESPPLFRLVKTFELVPGKPLANVRLDIENLTDAPLSLTPSQEGPLGVMREQMQYDMRRVMIAIFEDGVVSLSGHTYQRDKLAKKPQQARAESGQRVVYAASTNRYFGAFIRPLPISDQPADWILRVDADAATPQRVLKWDEPADSRVTLLPLAIDVPAGGAVTRAYEVYAGPKDVERLAEVNPAYADSTQLGYDRAQYADRYCMCTPAWLARFMASFLHGIYFIVRNYGVAIVVLVIIIRTCLHPLTVFQQKSMVRMQEAMAQLQPKMNAIKEKYANDRAKMNQEIMRLYTDEGVNPAGSLVSMLPMFAQMPILVAMWVALNGDVALRHEPFMLWINDLAAPDAFWTFAHPITIPILGSFSMFRDIPSINLIPILMGVSMYVQQKYMPKPGQQARHEAAKKHAAETGEPSQIEQQMKQQHTMAVLMSFLFPLMFYYMPSGLTLYWFATNVFGICETLIIRRQIETEKERRKAAGVVKPAPRRQGVVGRIMKRLAEQAEEIQKAADGVSKGDAGRGKSKPDKKKR